MSLLSCRACTTRFAVGAPACPQCGSTDHHQEDAGPMLPMIWVVCRTAGCRAEGKTQTVRLPPVGVNLVQVPTVVCVLCGAEVELVTPFSPGGEEGGGTMPKITRHGGPTNDAADPASAPAATPPDPAPAPARGRAADKQATGTGRAAKRSTATKPEHAPEHDTKPDTKPKARPR